MSLIRGALQCRLLARQYAKSETKANQHQLSAASDALAKEAAGCSRSPASLLGAVHVFHKVVKESLENTNKRSILFEACDDLRDVLRDHGLKVTDNVQQK